MKLPKLLIGVLLVLVVIIVGIVLLVSKAEPAPAITIFGEITLEKPAIMVIEKPEISVNKIEIKVKETVSDVTTTAKALAKKPAEVSAPEGKIYQYLDIKAENLASEKIDKVIIDFKVAQGWISKNSIDIGTVRLNRFTTEWTELPTQKVNEDSKFVYYEAEAPGLSYFAVTGEKSEIGELVKNYGSCKGSSFIWFEDTDCSAISDCLDWAEENANELEDLGFEKTGIKCCHSTGYCGYYSYTEEGKKEEEETRPKKEKLTKKDIDQIVFVKGLQECGLRDPAWSYSVPSEAFTSKIKKPCQLNRILADEEGNPYLTTQDTTMEYFRYVNIKYYELLPGEECGLNLTKEGFCDPESSKGGPRERVLDKTYFGGFEGYKCVVEEKPRQDSSTVDHLKVNRCGCKNLDNHFVYNGEWLGVCAGGYEFIIRNDVKFSRATKAHESMACLPKVPSMELCMKTLTIEIDQCLSEQ